MTSRFALTVSGLILSATSLTFAPKRAEAYPVDCAILLCLAGGWPASAECAQARATFIRRITPYPIEPPLQIWNCPMGVSYRSPAGEPLDQRIYRIAAERPASKLGMLGQVQVDRHSSKPEGLAPLDWLMLVDADPSQGADIDISGRAFDFVRSIHVYEVFYRQYESGPPEDRSCSVMDTTKVGRYGIQGNYVKQRSTAREVPDASALRIPEHHTDGNCPSYSFRSVFVEWTDYFGDYGTEEVQY
jgi:hypothetical protein